MATGRGQNSYSLVFSPISLKFGIWVNFRVLISNSTSKIRYEYDLRMKRAIAEKLALFNNSIAMATLFVTVD